MITQDDFQTQQISELCKLPTAKLNTEASRLRTAAFFIMNRASKRRIQRHGNARELRDKARILSWRASRVQSVANQQAAIERGTGES